MKLSTLLNELIEVEYDALAGSRAALGRLLSVGNREHIGRIVKEHGRHVTSLVAVVRGMRAPPWSPRDVSLVFTKAKVVFAARNGDDAILRAIRDSERGLIAAYALMLARALPTTLRELLEGHQSSALRNYDGLERRVKKPPTDYDRRGIVLRFPAPHVSLEEKR